MSNNKLQNFILELQEICNHRSVFTQFPGSRIGANEFHCEVKFLGCTCTTHFYLCVRVKINMQKRSRHIKAERNRKGFSNLHEDVKVVFRGRIKHLLKVLNSTGGEEFHVLIRCHFHELASFPSSV